MVSNPNLIFYACVARGTRILAEFNSKDADLATLAAKCLEKTPPLHSVFSHTRGRRTYTFFMDEHLTYFAIYDEQLKTSEVVSFLMSVRDAFDELVVSDNVKSLSNTNSHCFQGKFNPVFHKLLAPSSDFEGPTSLRDVSKKDLRRSLDSPGGKKIGSLPMLGGDALKNLKKKKKRLAADTIADGKDGLAEKKVDMSGDAVVLSRDLPVSMQKHGLFAADPGHQKAKRVWKRHVWVVLSLDLIVCTILFVVWLWICRGFKCIDD